MRHVQVSENLLGNASENRRADIAAVMSTLRRIQHDGDGDGWLRNGSESCEGRNVFGGTVSARGGIDLLCGTGLAARGVSIQNGLFTGAEESNFFENLLHLHSGERRDD